MLGSDFLSGLTLGNDGRTEPGSKIVGEFVELRIAVDFNGLLGGVADDVAVVAPGQVLFELDLCSIVERFV